MSVSGKTDVTLPCGQMSDKDGSRMYKKTNHILLSVFLRQTHDLQMSLVIQHWNPGVEGIIRTMTEATLHLQPRCCPEAQSSSS